MSFKSAIASTPGLETAYCVGLQALRSRDRAHLVAEQPRSLSGSVHLDQALQVEFPDQPRWDYGIGVRRPGQPECVLWVEIHPASSTHVKQVLSKLAWLRSWLRTQARALDRLPREFWWVASGSVALQPGSPQRKRLASHGLRLCGERMRIR